MYVWGCQGAEFSHKLILIFCFLFQLDVEVNFLVKMDKANTIRASQDQYLDRKINQMAYLTWLWKMFCKHSIAVLCRPPDMEPE